MLLDRRPVLGLTNRWDDKFGRTSSIGNLSKQKLCRQCGSKFAFEFIQSSVWVIIKTQIGPTTATGGERRETFPQTILVQPQRIFIHRSTDPGATTQSSRSIQDPSVQPRAEPQPWHEKPEKWNVASACLQSESGPSRRRTISMEWSSNNDVHFGQRRTSDRQLLR